MQESSPLKRKLGFAVLFAMTGLSFLSSFIARWQMDGQNLPDRKYHFSWITLATFAILFPVMASHLHSLWLHKRIRWLTWWCWISNATIGGFWIYSLVRDQKANSSEDEVGSFFFGAMVGGTLGGIIVFGIVRRFIPRWLGYQKPESALQRQPVSLKTIFFWLTSVGILLGAMVNGEALYLGVRSPYSIAVQVPVFILLGAFWTGLFCLLVFFFATWWLRVAKPFWLASWTLVVAGVVVPLAIAAWATTMFVSYSGGATTESLAYATLFGVAAVYAAVWILGNSYAGLLRSNENTKSGLFSKIGWSCKQALFAGSLLSLLYGAYWCAIHLPESPDRDPKLIQQKNLESFGGSEVGGDWIAFLNQQDSEGVSPENNLAVDLLKISNPFLNSVSDGDPRRTSQPVLVSFYTSYANQLGLSKSEFNQIPTSDYESWYEEKHQERCRLLAKKYPQIGAYFSPEIDFFESEPDSLDGLLDKAVEIEQPAKTDQPINERELTIATFLTKSWGLEHLTASPWDKSDNLAGAALIEAHQTQVDAIKSLDFSRKFFSPLLRDSNQSISQPGHILIGSAFFLISASANYHGGSGEIETAIKDCETLFALANLKMSNPSKSITDRLRWKNRAIETTERIAFLEAASVEQKKQLLNLIVSQPDHLDPKNLNLELLRAVLKERSWNDRYTFGAGGLTEVYTSAPWLIDWSEFSSAFDHYFDQVVSAVHSATAGELTVSQFNRRIQAATCFVYGNGRATRNDVYYSVFGHQLIALLRTPKAKGEILAKMSTGTMNQYFLYRYMTCQPMATLAIQIEIFKCENDEYPESLDQLQSQVAGDLPKDPYSQKDFIYKKLENDFLLYSVQENESDDGGSNADLLFERPSADFLDYVNRENAK